MANKIITQVPVASKHIRRLVIEPETIVGEVVTWRVTYDYTPVDLAGVSIRGTVKSRMLVVGSSTQTTLQTFVTNQVVTDANLAEGT